MALLQIFIEYLRSERRVKWLRAEAADDFLGMRRQPDAPKLTRIVEGQQAAVDRAGPQEKRYGALMTVSLREPPKVSLGVPEGRATVAGRVELTSPLLVRPAVPVDVVATAGIRYDDNAKAFFLDQPVAESIASPQLGRDAEPLARQAVNALLVNYFRSRPVYVLRDDASLKEKTARWLLKSGRIEPGKVVATLSPF